jgi:hypothetical protein
MRKVSYAISGKVMRDNIVCHINSNKAKYIEEEKQHSSVIAFYRGF